MDKSTQHDLDNASDDELEAASELFDRVVKGSTYPTGTWTQGFRTGYEGGLAVTTDLDTAYGQGYDAGVTQRAEDEADPEDN